MGVNNLALWQLITFIVITISSWVYGQSNEGYELLRKANTSQSLEEAEKYLQMAEKLFLVVNDLEGITQASFQKAYVYQKFNLKTKEYYALKEYKENCIRLNKKEYIAMAYESLFNYFLGIESFDSCLYYLDVIEQFQKRNSNKQLNYIFFSLLANYYLKVKNYDLAKEHLLHCIFLLNDTGKNISSYLSDLGNCYFYTNQLDSALHYYELGVREAQVHHDTVAVIYLTNNVGLVYKKRGDCQKGIQKFQEALELASKLNHLFHICNLNSNIAQCYLEEKRPTEAIQVAETYYKAIENTDFYVLKYEFSKIMTEAYEIMQQHNKALKYFKELSVWKDSLRNIQDRLNNFNFSQRLKIIEKNYNVSNSIEQEEINIWMVQALIAYSIIIVLIAYYELFRKKNTSDFSDDFLDSK